MQFVNTVLAEQSVKWDYPNSWNVASFPNLNKVAEDVYFHSWLAGKLFECDIKHH